MIEVKDGPKFGAACSFFDGTARNYSDRVLRTRRRRLISSPLRTPCGASAKYFTTERMNMPLISRVGFALMISSHATVLPAHPSPDVERIASRSEPGLEGGKGKAEAAATMVAARCRSESAKRTLRLGPGSAHGKGGPPVVRTESPREKCIRKGLAAIRRSQTVPGHGPTRAD